MRIAVIGAGAWGTTIAEMHAVAEAIRTGDPRTVRPAEVRSAAR